MKFFLIFLSILFTVNINANNDYIEKLCGLTNPECILNALMTKLDKDLEKYKSDDLIIAEDYMNIADLIHDRMSFDDKEMAESALNYYFKAVKIQEKIYGKIHCKTSNTYGDIGSSYYRLNRYEEALIFYFKALKTDLNLIDKYGRGQGSYYSDIASAYKELKQNNHALTYYLKAVEYEKKQLCTSVDSLYRLYGEIARIYRKQKKYDKAIDFYKKASVLVSVSRNPNSAKDYNYELSSVYKTQKKYNEAIIYFLKYMKLDFVDYTFYSFDDLAELYYKNQQFKESLLWYEYAIKEFEKRGLIPDKKTKERIIELKKKIK